MTKEKKWRSPINDYGPENGLDTGDIETFKKEPLMSLARETGQNSFDANNYPPLTKIEYHLFEVDRERIPGIDELSSLIEDCYEYKKDLKKEAEPLKKMLLHSRDKKIQCLRVSDYFTKGLEGVKTYGEKDAFYLLTKGSGISYKEGGTGGSKGIGKYASFVNSNINTVFYSTYNLNKEKGYMGVAKLRSAPILDTDGLKTQGIAYYSSNNKKEPILEEFSLDPSFKRQAGDYGTDVYIIGFNVEDNWKWSIISKLLESFMVAIQRENLVVDVDDITVSRETLKDLVYSPKLREVCGKLLLKDIQAQYVLLTDEEVLNKELDFGELGTVEVYVKKYDANQSDDATKKCVMIRYPYMKIKMTKNIIKLPFSAMCVIGDNKLNKLLKDIENPQHTDWEFNRLNDNKELKRETKSAEKLLRDKVREFISEVMQMDSSDETDVYGAGEFLPSVDKFGNVIVENGIKKDIVQIRRVKKNKPKEKKNEKRKRKGGIDMTKIGGGGMPPTPPGPTPPGPTPPGPTPPITGVENTNMKKIKLDGIKYRNIVVDEKQGHYDFRFTAPKDEAIFEIELKMYGDANDKYPLKIINAKEDGKALEIVDGKVRMSLKKGVNYVVEYTTNRKSMFSSEVLMYAYR